MLALNDGSGALTQGQAVAMTGVATDATGAPVLLVAPATKGDTVIGFMDVAMNLETVAGADKTDVSGYKPGGTTAPTDHMVRVVTGGLFTYALADESAGAIAVGDSLEASATTGKLAKASQASPNGTAVGFAAGTLSDGRVAIYNSQH